MQVWEGGDTAVGMELCWMEILSDIYAPAGEQGVSKKDD